MRVVCILLLQSSSAVLQTIYDTCSEIICSSIFPGLYSQQIYRSFSKPKDASKNNVSTSQYLYSWGNRNNLLEQQCKTPIDYIIIDFK